LVLHHKGYGDSGHQQDAVDEGRDDLEGVFVEHETPEETTQPVEDCPATANDGQEGVIAQLDESVLLVVEGDEHAEGD
jgi:hypothetical protein